MRPLRRGVILLYALAAVGLMLFMATALTEVYQAVRRANDHDCDRLRARAAAQAAVDDGFYQLEKNLYWTDGLNETLDDRTTYLVTFDSAQGLPYSVNNGNSTVAASGEGGRTVPAGCVHLIGIGRAGVAVQQREALVDVSSGQPVVRTRW